ncbi:alpha beta-hydrolase [Coniophora puteana RWD-64-598 SS2]|uniref:Alpha beta-hydrolase n=1 Tax=Coniophora puteana (strain RWD-64-598) TaxID=741705 RepID=A0A5M3MM14_CONPW|nr:alpha beta-hydrolase [Coniophora puteana RWD-64-598 SS2]EIW79715.1 alpha beta-hydrolase [Coniophora puteana RWD-64-598 SS2]
MMPLVPPPVSACDYPPLPLLSDSLRSSFLSSLPGYFVSTHVLPAAYPRAPSSKWVPPPLHQTKAAHSARAEADFQRLVALKEAQEQETLSIPPREEVLFSTVKCYRPTCQRSSGRPVTLLLLHGIGLHKESWEPFLSDLSRSLERGSSVSIDEIWSLEMVQHGDAGLINEHNQGEIFDAADYGRDTANFLLNYLPDEFGQEQCGVNLPRVSDKEAARRREYGFRNRTLVCVGHSLGASCVVFPALEMPKLFSSLVLVESVSIPEYMPEGFGHRRAEALCIKRQCEWSSWEEAESSIRSSRYYRRWSQQAVDEYIEHALSPTTHGTVRLKMHPYQEAATLMERRIQFETWELMASIPPSVRLHWIMSADSARTGGRKVAAEMVWRRSVNASNVLLEGIDHMVPQEAPDVLANLVVDFLQHEYGRPLLTARSVAGASIDAQQSAKL